MTFLLTPCPRSPPFFQPDAHPLIALLMATFSGG